MTYEDLWRQTAEPGSEGVTREELQAHAERMIVEASRNLLGAGRAASYEKAWELAHIGASKVAALDITNGDLITLGAVCIALLRETMVKFPEARPHATLPAEEPPCPASASRSDASSSNNPPSR